MSMYKQRMYVRFVRCYIMADLLVVKAKIKDVIGDYNVAGDFADELDKIVRENVAKAVKRAEANGRRTVMAKDL